jgi:hypothetical protein
LQRQGDGMCCSPLHRQRLSCRQGIVPMHFRVVA